MNRPVGDHDSPLELVPDPTVRLDRDGLIIDLNQEAADLAGTAPDGLLGRRCADVFRPRNLDGDPLLLDGWHTSASLRGVKALPEHEVVIATAGGDIHVRVTGRYHRESDDGAVAGLVLSLRRPRRVADREPTGVEVVSTVSHELRSPLTSVKGYTSLLLNRWDRLKDEQKRTMLEQVHHDADRVTRLITELLDISRLETGRLLLRRQMVDLASLSETVVQKLSLTYDDLDASLDFADDFPRVYADPDKLEQVLTNLVENAAKYASPKGMRIDGEVHETQVTVAVTDSGEGIPPADLAKVFHKFFRREVGKPSGTGLGLWISRGLVEAHGGRLSAVSEVGRGSTFRFVIPLVSIDDLLVSDE